MTDRKARRRSNGEGGISQRPNGAWEARITLPGGKRRSFYAATKALALAKLRDAHRLVDEGRPLGPERLTVQAWLQQWLQDTLSPHAGPPRPNDIARYAVST